MHRKLNIPIGLLLEVVKNRKDLELLALRVFVMLAYKNATIYNVSAAKISKMFKCDKPTSERLLCAAKHSSWFAYSSNKNSLRALSMKSRNVKHAKSGMSYTSDLCYCMDLDYISLNEMVKRLRGIVIMMIIVQATREPSKRAKSETESFILVYQATFAKYLGLSTKSVCRLLQHLSNIGWVDKTKQYFYKVKELKNAPEEKIKEYEKKNQNCHLAVRESSRYYCRTKTVDFNYYKCFGLGYSVDDSFSRRFRTIMWTHKKRVNAVKNTQYEDKRILVSIPEYEELLFNHNYPLDYVQQHFRVA